MLELARSLTGTSFTFMGLGVLVMFTRKPLGAADCFVSSAIGFLVVIALAFFI